MSKQEVEQGDSALRSWRTSKNMTLEDLAGKLGVSVATLSRVETGVTKRIDPDFLARIKKVTGLDYEKIVG